MHVPNSDGNIIMVSWDQNEQCDLILGFSLDMLVDIISSASKEVVISADSIASITPSYKHAFKTYFQSGCDKIVSHVPHGARVVDEKQLALIAWGTGTLCNGTKTYVFELSHHFFVKYSDPDIPGEEGTISFDYNGTEICSVEGGVLDAVPMRMIRQVLQSTIKKSVSHQIKLKPPSVNFPYADTVIELNRLIIDSNKSRARKEGLYFQLEINENNYLFGGFDVKDSKTFSLDYSYLLRKGQDPINISIRGVNPVNKRVYAKSSAAVATAHDVISYRPEPNKICGHFDSLMSSFTLEYSIKRISPLEINANFLNLELNPNTNSFCVKYNYYIDGVENCLAPGKTISEFVYPYGLGVMVSENLFKKIFQAYCKFSTTFPETFCSNSETIAELTAEESSVPIHSLSISSAETLLGQEKMNVMVSLKSIADEDKSIGILKMLKASGTEKKSLEHTVFEEQKNVLIKTVLDLTADGKFDMTLGNIELGAGANKLLELKGFSDKLYDRLINMFSGMKINLLNLPDSIGISEESFKLTYNYTNVSPRNVIIGSEISGMGSNTAPDIKPTLPFARAGYESILFFLKDKWGFEGTEKGNFAMPCGVAVSRTTDSNVFVYVADRNNNRVQKFDVNGGFILEWGVMGGGEGELNSPGGLAVDMNNDIYVVDTNNNRVQKFDPEGRFLSKFGKEGSGDGKFLLPQEIVVDDKGYIYVTDSNDFVQKFDKNCKFVKQWGGKGIKKGKFCSPRGIGCDGSGFLYVVDAGNHRVQKFNMNGKFILQWGCNGSDDGQFIFPQGVAVSENDFVYVADTGNNRVQKFDTNGTYISMLAGEGALIGQFLGPSGITAEDDDIYVADSFNNRIQKFGS